MEHLRVGLRGSLLSKTQANLFCNALLAEYPDTKIELVEIVTSGDEKQGLGENIVRDKRDWIDAIEEAVCSGRVDCALHSGKDVPAIIPEGTSLLPVLRRENPRDALIVRELPLRQGIEPPVSSGLDVLPEGALVGTVSPRRQAQIRHLRPDLRVTSLRGNVPTRIAKLEGEGDLNAIVLAASGLIRLGLQGRVASYLSTASFLPAVNQGILAAQYLSQNTEIAQTLSAVVDRKTRAAFFAEREVVGRLGADCHSALGVYAEVHDDEVMLLARVYAPDGSQMLEASESGEEAAKNVADQLISEGALELMELQQA